MSVIPPPPSEPAEIESQHRPVPTQTTLKAVHVPMPSGEHAETPLSQAEAETRDAETVPAGPRRGE